MVKRINPIQYFGPIPGSEPNVIMRNADGSLLGGSEAEDGQAEESTATDDGPTAEVTPIKARKGAVPPD